MGVPSSCPFTLFLSRSAQEDFSMVFWGVINLLPLFRPWIVVPPYSERWKSEQLQGYPEVVLTFCIRLPSRMPYGCLRVDWTNKESESLEERCHLPHGSIIIFPHFVGY